MQSAAENLDFEKAAFFRDEVLKLSGGKRAKSRRGF